MFNHSGYSVDCVKLLNEEQWVTAGEDGHLAVWGVVRKKPLATVSSIVTWIKTFLFFPMGNQRLRKYINNIGTHCKVINFQLLYLIQFPFLTETDKMLRLDRKETLNLIG